MGGRNGPAPAGSPLCRRSMTRGGRTARARPTPAPTVTLLFLLRPATCHHHTLSHLPSPSRPCYLHMAAFITPAITSTSACLPVSLLDMTYLSARSPFITQCLSLPALRNTMHAHARNHGKPLAVTLAPCLQRKQRSHACSICCAPRAAGRVAEEEDGGGGGGGSRAGGG